MAVENRDREPDQEVTGPVSEYGKGLQSQGREHGIAVKTEVLSLDEPEHPIRFHGSR